MPDTIIITDVIACFKRIKSEVYKGTETKVRDMINDLNIFSPH